MELAASASTWARARPPSRSSRRALIHVDSLPVGGGHVTADIARGWSTSVAGAERIKTLHGSAIASANEDREMIEAPPRGDDIGAGPVVVPRSLLKGIIAPRVEETFELLRERLKNAGMTLEPGAGMVLTGGASQLAGVREVAVRVFDRPVRLAARAARPTSPTPPRPGLLRGGRVLQAPPEARARWFPPILIDGRPKPIATRAARHGPRHGLAEGEL